MRQKTTTYGCKITIKRYKRTTECDWKQLEGHTKWPQRDGEQPQKRKMMTNNAYCFPSVWGDILQCTVKRGGGVVYMSVPSSPLCHNPWLQQRQRGNQRWRCRNTLRAAWRKPDGYYTWAGSHTSRPAGTLLKPVYPEEEHLVVIQ